MARNITIDPGTFQGIGRWFSGLKDAVLAYFSSITSFQQYAWMAVGAGIVFIVVAIVLW